MARCSAIKADGQPCRGIAATGTDYCPAHDPARAEARKRSASKAARARHGAASGEIAELKDALTALYDEVRNGAVQTRVGAILCQILNAQIRAVETGRKIKETEELESRIEELERRRGVA